MMGLVSAYRQAGGIQVNDDMGDGTIDCRFVSEGDAEWLVALAALPPEDAEPVSAAPPGLERTRAEAITGINRVIGQVRSQFITVIAGQDSIYAAKEAEARAYLNNQLTLAECPFLQSEIGLTAPDANALAQIWLNMSALWRQIGAVLEGLRIAAVLQLEQALDLATIAAIKQTFFAQLNQIAG